MALEEISSEDISAPESVVRKRRDSHITAGDTNNKCQECKSISDFRKTPVLPREELCTVCQRFDFGGIEQPKQKTSRGTFLLHLNRTVEELRGSECALCRVFAAAVPAAFQKQQPCHLRTFSAINCFWGPDSTSLQSVNDMILIAVVQTPSTSANTRLTHDAYLEMRDGLTTAGFIGVRQTSQIDPCFSIRLQCSQHVDLNFIRSCLSYCRRWHSVCNRKDKQPPFLRVVDCQQARVVDAPKKCKYIALSYVFGTADATPLPSVHEDYDRTDILGTIPKVISDSIKMTLRLGFRYLWIDRYCIDQDDEMDRLHQIRQMDQVYANAVLTIIAAAGDDPEYGLAGMPGTPRKQQHYAKLSDEVLVATLPSPENSADQSTWATRGWTYQEALLSRRRVYFTGLQAEYECAVMRCVEALAEPIDELHTDDRTTYREGHIRKAKLLMVPGEKPLEIMKHIAGFTKRQLTFETDALDAMEGIFQRFAKSVPPVLNFSGVPILPRTLCPDTQIAMIIGLSWWTQTPKERRLCFPSWTWAGWTGGVGSFARLYTPRYSKRQAKSDEHTIMEAPDYQTISLDEIDQPVHAFTNFDDLQSFLERANRRVKSLHIRARTSDFSIVPYEPSQFKVADAHASEFYCRSGYLVYQHELDVYAEFCPDAKVDTFLSSDRVGLSTKYNALILQVRNPDSSDNLFAILVQELADGSFERFGSFNPILAWKQTPEGLKPEWDVLSNAELIVRQFTLV